VKQLWAVGAALLLAFAYLLNLDSLYAPSNGDEMVYLHIARLTSESGHWLPLVSDLHTPTGGEMRNTKPPLLFWQAMFAGQWSWDLFTLRLPYVLETLLTAGLVGWLTSQLIRVRPQLKIGLLAAALYLGCFATYRYGRPALSSSIESLFLFGACAFVIAKQSSWKAYPIRLAAVVGLLMIPALLSKSFVLAAPVGLWLFMALWVTSEAKNALQKFWQSAWLAAAAVAVGVAGFSLWFAADPNPAAVWREFVIGENFSTKFSDNSSSIFAFWLSPLVNAGLIFPLVMGLLVTALQAIRSKASSVHAEEKMLWLWVLCWMLVFTLPSQRSARYVIPIMPAIAVLLVMYADRIHRIWWRTTLGLIALATAALGWIVWCLDGVFASGSGYPIFYFVAFGLLLVACCVGLVQAKWRMGCTASAAVVWLALLGALAAPFDVPSNQYSTAAKAQLAGQKILVPQNFNAQFERFTFILPASQPFPYEASTGLPASFNAGEVIASRLVLRGRQDAGEVTWAALSSVQGVQRLLVEREVLIGTKN
jgi:4-amino-4-deoxy-L-arabinose transferase-like glycosyltransferase